MGSAPAPEIKVKITGEDTGVSAAIRELSLQLNQLKRTQDETGTSAQRMGDAEAGAGRSMREAREGARLLSEETGVHLNRGLTGIIARSQTLGPILNAAFPVAAAIGFGEVIIGTAEKFSTLIADTFIFTDAMKAAYKAQVDINTEIAKRAQHVQELDKAYALIGLKGTAREVVELQQMGKEIDKVQKQISDFENKRGAARVGALGTGGTAIQFTDADQLGLGNAQSKLNELQKEQANLEKQTMADDAEKRQEIAKARLAQIEAGFANELALYKAQHSKLDQDNEASYVKGLESLAQYYDRKRQLAAEASQKEIDALTAERQRVLSSPTKPGQEGETERIANQTKAAALANQIAIAKVNAAKTVQQLTDEQSKKQDELDKKVLEFQSQIARAQGLRFDEAAARIAAEATEMADKLREAGLASDQVDAMVAKFKSAATQQAQFASKKTTGEGAIADLSSAEEDIRLKNSAIVADVKIAELERTRIPVLQKIAAELKASAVGPQQIREADDFAKGVNRIEVAAQRSAVSMKNFKDQASQAIAGDLARALGQTITQARSVGDAFRQLAQSAVSSIQQIVAQMLIQLLMQKLLKSAAAGFASGGLVPGHAAGGLITGPGTSTSDSIPARLSAGEFVVNAAAVQQVGLPTLARINSGLHVPSIRGMSIPGFAQGGLVQTGGGGAMDLKLGLALDEGLVLKHLSSKAAQKIVLQHIGNNPKAVAKAISRGQAQ